MTTSPLLDRLGRAPRDLRLSVTDRCNLRCGYCMPADRIYHFSPRAELLTFEEMARVTRLFAELGVRKIRLTGGEPLLRKDLPKLVGLIRAIPQIQDIALTTNGVFLPRLAPALKAAGLNRITVSLDSLRPEVLQQLSGRKVDPDQIVAGIQAAREAQLEPIKVNMVVQKGINEADMLPMLSRFGPMGIELRFIEFMDVGTLNQWNLDTVVTAEKMLAHVSKSFNYKPIAAEHQSDVAMRYVCENGYRFGIIASVTKPFCGHCTRARISSTGQLFTCLFAEQGLDLRQHLRAGSDDSHILSLLKQRWQVRDDRYSEQRTQAVEKRTQKKVEMYHIGG